MKTSLLVVGGGASGLTAAGFASREGVKTTVLERRERPARKLLLTGKGRCNLTNDCPSLQKLVENVPRNGKFLYGAFSRFMPADVMKFFEGEGVKLKTERGGRVFPVSDSAADIADALVKFAGRGAKIVRGRAARLLFDGSSVSGVETESGDVVKAEKIIIATGGLSYPNSGSTGDGYKLARSAGHAVIKPVPSLVPLELCEGFCADLAGLSLRNTAIRVVDSESGKTVYTDFGEMLFTPFGASGPMILSASAHMRDMKKGKYKIFIDLKPALSLEKLDARILRDFSENPNKNFINALDSLLPKKLVPVVAKLGGLKASLKVNQITRESRLKLARLLKEFAVVVSDFRPIEEAIITSGGVDVSEINPKTMESKLAKGLYFAGEVIDADAYTGGFNLQIAFSTGRLAGLSAAEEIKKLVNCS